MGLNFDRGVQVKPFQSQGNDFTDFDGIGIGFGATRPPNRGFNQAQF